MFTQLMMRHGAMLIAVALSLVAAFIRTPAVKQIAI
jgi:hypothetical protein